MFWLFARHSAKIIRSRRGRENSRDEVHGTGFFVAQKRGRIKGRGEISLDAKAISPSFFFFFPRQRKVLTKSLRVLLPWLFYHWLRLSRPQTHRGLLLIIPVRHSRFTVEFWAINLGWKVSCVVLHSDEFMGVDQACFTWAKIIMWSRMTVIWCFVSLFQFIATVRISLPRS